MNKIILTGRLTKNPELRYTTSNVAVCQFSLAVTRNFKNQNGEYESDFITCITYRNSAEMMAEWTKKGDLLGIEGRLQTRSYDDKDGKKVYVSEVIVDRVEFLSSRKKEETVEEPEQEVRDPFEEFGDAVTIDDNFLD